MITSNSKSGFNKKDLTEQLAAKAGIPKSTAAKTINLFTTIISEALVDGKKVTISDFGTFNLSERSALKDTIHKRSTYSVPLVSFRI